ncbi:MAG TPA: alanine racemase [Kiritimatiellia bacterium]|mgnify:CR=1 FL=1|nr:alanine racemase [Kiritimatiellia bacterium]HPS06138.1 alanine racemase [Kiritimatiellia bacterium]
MNTIPRRVWLEISLDTLTQNYRKIADAVAPANVLTVLKANAYGLGVLPIARALAKAGASGFGVAEPYEALQLLPLGKPVQILSSILPEEIDPMIAAGVTLPVTDLATARLISEAAMRLGKTATVHFKLDTGMGRLGILASEAPAVIRETWNLPGLYCEGIFSHFPYAYETGSELTNRQMDLFCTILDDVARDGITFAKRHIANSDAINNFPRACRAPFNVVRTGINLHGSFDTAGKRTLRVKPVLTLKTRLTAIRTLPAGTGIGYGHTYRLHTPTLVGTVSAGYADGLPLALSNRGYLLIHGIPCPVLGRLSMDYTTVSLESVPGANVGDEVVCLGGEGIHALTVEDWAALKNTHPYEIICSFGNRVERRYV